MSINRSISCNLLLSVLAIIVSCYKIKNKGICRFYSLYTIASTFSKLNRSALTKVLYLA